MSLQLQVRIKHKYTEEIKDIIREAWLQTHPKAVTWVRRNVPRDTGRLIESFFSQLETGQTVSTIYGGFQIWYAKYAESMTNRNRFPRDGSRISPFLQPLVLFIRAQMLENMIRVANQRRIKLVLS